MNNDKILSKVEVHQVISALMAMLDVDKLWLPCLLDWVDGYIEQTINGTESPLEQLLKRKG